MIRTQIQLTEEQSRALKEVAGERNVSMAELIRQAVNYYLQATQPVSRLEQRQRALAIVGQFRSGASDTSERHDEVLAEAYGEWSSS